MIRLASVRYLNAKPLTDAIDRSRFSIKEGHPSEIATLLLDGKVDAALVPVATVLASSEDLRIIGGVAIGANGPVESVLLVGEVPPEQWTELYLDGASRSSAALTRVLLEGDLKARLVSLESVLDVPPTTAIDRAKGTTAALTIGDTARDLPDRFQYKIDLAEYWHKTTDLPFVFAVWACRPSLSPAVAAEIVSAGKQGVSEIPKRYSGEDLRYLQEALSYALEDRELIGLRRFAALGKMAGIFTNADCAMLAPVPVSNDPVDLHGLLSHGIGHVELVVGDERAAGAALGMQNPFSCGIYEADQAPSDVPLLLRCEGSDATGQIARALTLARSRSVGLIVPPDIIDIAEAAAVWGGLNVVVLTDKPDTALAARVAAISNAPVPQGATRPPQRPLA
jgi:predicted solute-binding protein